MAYQIQISPRARRQLRRLSFSVQEDVREAIDSLSQQPRPLGCRKLRGSEDLWRIRVGDYRVIYQVLDRVLYVRVVAIGHRREIYR